jgi:hypothetical protein
MNWEALGAVGELVGGIAVIATLIYLSIQIRQNTNMNASAVRQSFYDYTARQMLHGTDSKEFHAMLDRACMTDDELSSGERLQLFRFFQAVFVGYQCAFYQFRHKALNQDDWNVIRSLLRSFWLLPGKEIARLWAVFKTGGILDNEFIAEVERLRDDAQEHLQGLEDKGLELGHS